MKPEPNGKFTVGGSRGRGHSTERPAEESSEYRWDFSVCLGGCFESESHVTLTGLHPTHCVA